MAKRTQTPRKLKAGKGITNDELRITKGAMEMRNADFGLRKSGHRLFLSAQHSALSAASGGSPLRSDVSPASRSPVAEEDGEVEGVDDVIVVEVRGVVGVRAPIAQENG